MYGAILGDMIGSHYEFGEKVKTKEFAMQLWKRPCYESISGWMVL